MKLCYIANANSIHTRRWIAPFVERGDSVHLLSHRPVKDPIEGVDLVDLTRIANMRKVRFAQWGWWIFRYVRRIQPDILHAQALAGAGWLGIMANYHPFVTSAWGSDVLVEPSRSALRRLLIKLVLRQCDCLTVPSQLMHNAATALGLPGARLRLIPWGIETEIFRPTPNDRLITRNRLGIDPQALVILCPRGIASKYNHDVMLQAIPDIALQTPRLLLILLRFGVDEGYLNKLEQMISARGLSVLWLEPQETPADMARLYRMADVVVSIPSSEGYGFTVYEAMSSGCPTLISDLPVFEGELVNGMHTLKVPVRDIAQTRRMLWDLLARADLRQELREHALGICRNKSVKNRIEQTDTLYRELLSKHPSRLTQDD